MPIASVFGALSESNDQPSQVTAMENAGGSSMERGRSRHNYDKLAI